MHSSVQLSSFNFISLRKEFEYHIRQIEKYSEYLVAVSHPQIQINHIENNSVHTFI